MNNSKAVDILKLSLSYDGKGNVFDGLDLSVREGKLTGIIGPNGSGKTTLLKCIAGFLRPQSGDIQLFGQAVSALRASDKAKMLAYVSQKQSFLDSFLVEEIVMMGRYNHIKRFASPVKTDRDAVNTAMVRTGILDLADRRVDELSGGEAQRVAIARALAQQSRILLLDEPVSSLDIRHQLEIMELVRSAAQNQGITVICVLHDINLAFNYCDEIALIHGGRVHSFGTADEVLTEKNLGEVYGVKAQNMSDGTNQSFHFTLQQAR